MVDMEKIRRVQEDLHSGMSIDEVCRKYEITFKELCRDYTPYPKGVK